MTAQIIDGRRIARELEEEISRSIAELASRSIIPGLVAIRVGDDPASELYVRNKAAKAQELGLRGRIRHLPAATSEASLLAEIEELNADDDVDGILVQLPLPKQIDMRRVIDAIDPLKDVDGFNPLNVGKLALGRRALAPCTPAGIIRLLESTGIAIAGARAVVIGRSDIVGKPTAALLQQRNATVTVCHSATRDLGSIVATAGIVVAAVGRPYTVEGEMVREGAVVIDVGINRVDSESPYASRVSADPAKRDAMARRGAVIVGDVDFPAASARASWITPVPGGVGPMTIAMLMRNTVDAAKERRG